jgi:hypothetical protein
MAKKNVILSYIYHSPTVPPGTLPSVYTDDYFEKLDSHLNQLCETGRDIYVFLDSNINLQLNENKVSRDYMDIIISNGFVQLLSKATRIQGDSCSLIDHILTITNLEIYSTGTIISDISDHFINFILLPITIKKQKMQNIKQTKLFYCQYQ